MNDEFSAEQKRYLEGFAAGIGAGKLAGGAAPASVPSGPDASHVLAQDKVISGGGKLTDQEKWKRAEHPFDAYPRLRAQADKAEYPKPEDNFRWRYYGLFYVAPAQSNYMCRLRIPNGILNHWQMEGLAATAERLGGGYAHITTRANLQIREIAAEHATDMLEAIQDLGLCSRGSGADNIRNVTGDATAGIAAQEIVDTRQLARAWHFHILNDRSLYGLPRKFNVAFDGGGPVATLEETNDIGFQAVLTKPSEGAPARLLWRLVLGGITGHKDLARPSGVFCESADCVPVADAILRVFIASGNRTDRTKARLKYVLDEWGFSRFVDEVETVLKRKLLRIEESALSPRPAIDRHAHIGVHAQKQPGLNWVGASVPVGKMSADQMTGVARLAREFGDGDIRLTVWQNFLLSGVRDAHVASLIEGLAQLGLPASASTIASGLVACTGKTACKFGAAYTKESALALSTYLDARLLLDQPVNIHFTGCPNSCAQHYIGDIGLMGVAVPLNEDGDTVEGYDIVVGGGFGDQAKIGRLLWPKVPAGEVNAKVERLLRAYLSHRHGPDESFQFFVARLDETALIAAAEATEIAP